MGHIYNEKELSSPYVEDKSYGKGTWAKMKNKISPSDDEIQRSIIK